MILSLLPGAIPFPQREYVCWNWWIQASSIGIKPELCRLISLTSYSKIGPYLLSLQQIYAQSLQIIQSKIFCLILVKQIFVIPLRGTRSEISWKVFQTVPKISKIAKKIWMRFEKHRLFEMWLMASFLFGIKTKILIASS